VPPYYDSLIAKLLVSGRDRDETIIRSRRALSMLKVEGIKTSVALHLRILDSEEFVTGRIDTHFMERFLSS
jgi:acetyl-CoA carboxylase, biotin carboxylase subunit